MFRSLITEVNTSMAVAVLGQNLTTEVQGGAYAAASVHQEVKREVIRDDARSVRECLGPQMLQEWALYNFGDRLRAPSPELQTDPPEDKKAKGETWKIAGEAAKAAREGGLNIDREQLADEFDMPLVEGKPTLEPEPPQPPPGEGGKPPPGKGGRVQTSRLEDLPQGALRGQTTADDIADDARRHGARILRPDLAELLTLIEQAQDYDDLRQKLVALYRDRMDAEALSRLIEKTTLLAHLDGRWSVLEDL